MGMMKFKVRFRSEKGAFGFQRLDLCFFIHRGGVRTFWTAVVMWYGKRRKSVFIRVFFGSSDNDEERRINRGMYEWHLYGQYSKPRDGDREHVVIWTWGLYRGFWPIHSNNKTMRSWIDKFFSEFNFWSGTTRDYQTKNKIYKITKIHGIQPTYSQVGSNWILLQVVNELSMVHRS